MIDLHTHSEYSPDGCETVEYMLKTAENLKLKYLAITDHNCCKAYKDVKNEEIRKNFSGKIIPGVELNTKVLGIPIEILGYNVNPEKMQELIEKTYLSNIDRNKIEVERLYEKAVKVGVNLPKNFVEKYDGTYYGSKYFHDNIILDENNKKFINENSWKDGNIFYREYMSNPKTPFYVNVDDVLPDFEKASSIVKNAGGLVFLPHIFEYRENSEKILKHILSNYKIDGIECYYRNFTENQTEYLLNICKNNNLFVSGGSDFHGRGKPKIKMGTGEGTLNVPNEIVEDWINKKIIL